VRSVIILHALVHRIVVSVHTGLLTCLLRAYPPCPVVPFVNLAKD